MIQLIGKVIVCIPVLQVSKVSLLVYSLVVVKAVSMVVCLVDWLVDVQVDEKADRLANEKDAMMVDWLANEQAVVLDDVLVVAQVDSMVQLSVYLLIVQDETWVVRLVEMKDA